MLDVLVKPRARQVLVIVRDGRQIGYCLACRCRDGDRIADLVAGTADGTNLSDAEFAASAEDSLEQWKQRYPEAQIVQMDCPNGLSAMTTAKLEAEMRVR